MPSMPWFLRRPILWPCSFDARFLSRWASPHAMCFGTSDTRSLSVPIAVECELHVIFANGNRPIPAQGCRVESGLEPRRVIGESFFHGPHTSDHWPRTELGAFGMAKLILEVFQCERSQVSDSEHLQDASSSSSLTGLRYLRLKPVPQSTVTEEIVSFAQQIRQSGPGGLFLGHGNTQLAHLYQHST